MNKKVWEKPISKKQKRSLSICPHCKKKFYYWQYASKHAEENRHWGNYATPLKDKASK